MASTGVGREPALILALISSALGLVVTLNIGLTSAQAGLIVALIAAVFGAVTAAVTRPISPAAFTALVGAIAALLAGYHFNISPGVIGSFNALITTFLMLIVRGHVTPTVRGGGAGPVV